MSLNSPLDLKQIFMIDLAGSIEIFSFLAMVFVGIAIAKLGFNEKEAMVSFVLFGILMSTYLQGLYLIIILITGLVVYYQLAKMSK